MILAKPTVSHDGLAILLCPGNGFAEPAQPFTQDTGIGCPLVAPSMAHSAQYCSGTTPSFRHFAWTCSTSRNKIVRTVEATTKRRLDYVAKFHLSIICKPRRRYDIASTRVDDTDETGLAVKRELFFVPWAIGGLPIESYEIHRHRLVSSLVLTLRKTALERHRQTVSPDVICLYG